MPPLLLVRRGMLLGFFSQRRHIDEGGMLDAGVVYVDSFRCVFAFCTVAAVVCALRGGCFLGVKMRWVKQTRTGERREGHASMR